MSLQGARILLIGLLASALFYLLVRTVSHKAASIVPANRKAAALDTEPASQPESIGKGANGQAALIGYTGVILPSQEATLASVVEGQVDSIRVNLGDSVHQGDIMATLDIAGRLRAELVESQAVVQATSADLDRAIAANAHATDVAKRQTEAFKDGATSAKDLSDAEHQVAVTRLQVEAAKAKAAEKQASVQRVSHLLREADIRAPFDGTVAARYVQKGEMIKLGKPIFRIIGSAPAMVRFAVPQEVSPLLRISMPIEIRINGDGRLLQGKVSRIAPELDFAANMLIAEAIINVLPPAEVLTRGALAKVRFYPPQLQ